MSYRIRHREKPVGMWALYLLFSGFGFVVLAVAMTLFMQFRRRIFHILYALDCYSPDAEFSRSNCSVYYPWSLWVGIGFLLSLWLISPFIRRVVWRAALPVMALFSLTPILVFALTSTFDIRTAFWCAIFGGISLMGMFFEIVPSDEVASEKLKKRWMGYWKIRKWQDQDTLSAGLATIAKLIVLGCLKVIYLDFFAIPCPKCRRSFFFKDALSFNYPVEDCPHCGLRIKEWAAAGFKKTRADQLM